MAGQKALLEITELMNGYARAADANDADAWAACFTPGGVLRDGVRTLSAQKERARLGDLLPDGIRRHFLSGVHAEVRRDVATGGCAFQIVVTTPGGPSVIAQAGEYRDRLRRIDGRWLLEERVVVTDGGPVTAPAGVGDLADSALTEMKPGEATFKVTVPAGPLWSNDDAQKIGPMIAAAHFGRFTGQWRTMVPGRMSVVEIELPAERKGSTEFTMDVPAGPIWNQEDAKRKCPAICASYGGTWNGHWTTVVPGRFSVAGCVFTV